MVYELLDEMLDNGYPLATEANILKELIKPPNILRTVVNTVTGLLITEYTLHIVWVIVQCKLHFNSAKSCHMTHPPHEFMTYILKRFLKYILLLI